MNISDATGSHSLTTFNEIAAEIVGMPLQELINLKVNDNNAYVQKINDTVSKEYLFRLKREKKAFQVINFIIHLIIFMKSFLLLISYHVL